MSISNGHKKTIPKWIEPPDLDYRTLGKWQIYPSFHPLGHTFSPKRVIEETGFRAFTDANEPGEVNVAGPFRGRSLDYGPGYGAAIIRPPDGVPVAENLSWRTQVLVGHSRKFRKEFGIIGEVLYLTVHYQRECCFVLPAWALQSLRDTPVVVTCVQNWDIPN